MLMYVACRDDVTLRRQYASHSYKDNENEGFNDRNKLSIQELSSPSHNYDSVKKNSEENMYSLVDSLQVSGMAPQPNADCRQ